MICPRCNGAGAYRALVCPSGELRDITCSLCGGARELSDEQALRLEDGARMRRERIDRGESLREAARRLGISPSDLSRLEHGQ